MHCLAFRHRKGNNVPHLVTLKYYSDSAYGLGHFATEQVTPEDFPEFAAAMRDNGIEVTLVWDVVEE